MEHLLGIHGGPGSISSTAKTGYGCTYLYRGTEEVEAGRAEDHLWLPTEFETSLDYRIHVVLAKERKSELDRRWSTG